MEKLHEGSPSLSDVLDGHAEAIVTDGDEGGKKTTEPLIDGVAASKAFRHREVIVVSPALYVIVYY